MPEAPSDYAAAAAAAAAAERTPPDSAFPPEVPSAPRRLSSVLISSGWNFDLISRRRRRRWAGRSIRNLAAARIEKKARLEWKAPARIPSAEDRKRRSEVASSAEDRKRRSEEASSAAPLEVPSQPGSI